DSDDEINNVPLESGEYVSGLSISSQLSDFRCIVCYTVPFSELYQCQNGHLICAGCYQIRVLDKMLGCELGTCPQCRVRIYRHRAYRNMLIEQALAAVVVACKKCAEHLPRNQLRQHAIHHCPHRLIACKYQRVGCSWKGKIGILQEAHNENCEFRHKTVEELLKYLRVIQEKRDARAALQANVLKFLQLPHITARLVHIMPFALPFPRNCYAIGHTFEAFTQHWSIKFKWMTPTESVEPGDSAEPNEDDDDPCALLFQLCMEYPDATRGPLGLTYTLLGSIYSDIRFQPNLCEKHDFTHENPTGPPALLYENSLCNVARLLNERGFYARLLMARI
ncbi:hypothetical protein KR093_007498, partial [Drosophila rubida]